MFLARFIMLWEFFIRNYIENNNDLNLKDEIGNYNIRELRNRNPKFGKHNRPNLFYPVYANPILSDKDGFSPVSLERNEKYIILSINLIKL